MITIADIKDEANTRTYLKGRQLYQEDHVLHLDYEDSEEDGYAQRVVKAVVQGSGYNQYNVTINVDEEYHTIVESRCNCKAFSSYTGICKHCVAVLLTYIDVQKNGAYKHSESQPNESIQNGASLFHMKQWQKPEEFIVNAEPLATQRMSEIKTTTAGLKKLLDIKMVESTLPYVQNEYIGQVRLVPYLNKQEDTFHLEFKIGIGHMYVLKDMQEFLEAFQTKEPYRYGQKLKFIHHEDMFAEDSKQILRFLLKQLTKMKRENPYQFRYVSKSKIRELFLGGEELEEFLNIVEEHGVQANIDYTGEKLWRIEETNVKREIAIIGEPLGISLQVNGAVNGYRGNEYSYYFQEGVIHKVSLVRIKELDGFLTCLSNIKSKTLFISKADIPLFVRELYPILNRHYEIVSERFDVEQYQVAEVSFEIYLDMPVFNYITCEVKAIYGEQKYNVYAEKENQSLRDISKEMMVGQVVASYCSAYEEKKNAMVILDDEEKLYTLLMEGIPRLQEIAAVYVSDNLKAIKVGAAAGVSVGVSLSGDILELNLISEDMEMDQLIEILSMYDRKKKYYRLRNGDFLNIQGESLETLIELQNGLQIPITEWEDGKVVLPKYRALYLDAHLKEKHGLPYTKNKDFKALIRNMKTIDDNDFELPKGLNAVLREYQKVGFLWIKTLNANGFGGILADDMGLGKTIQVIAFLLSEYEERKEEDENRCLIVTPASLVFNWHLEIQKFAGSLPTKMVVGTAQERKEIIQTSGKTDILITSYDLLKRDLSVYENCKFAYQIIDEAQYIKNHNTRAAKAVKDINATFCLALTGTPMENRLSELWSIFDFIMPGFLRSYSNFKDNLEVPIVSEGDEEAMKRLHKLIHPFILRRLKKDVLTDLPDKLEEELFAKLSGEQQKLYDAHVKRMQMMLENKTDKEFRKSRIQILAELTKLRQICCDPSLLFEEYKGGSAKMDMCMDLLKRAVESGHKVLLFSQFTTMLEQLQIRMLDENITYYTLTGATNKEKRAKLVESFNEDDTSVFCISLKAGGTGLNLTSADIVIHFDPWWNVAVQNQATDRAHRIGQKNVVSVYKLLTKGTIEENIVKLQAKKTALAEQVLGGGEISGNGFTKEELLELLQGHDS